MEADRSRIDAAEDYSSDRQSFQYTDAVTETL